VVGESLLCCEKAAKNHPDALLLFSPPYRLIVVKIGTIVKYAFFIRNEETLMIFVCMKFFNT
jgi:hypothetical protein